MRISAITPHGTSQQVSESASRPVNRGLHVSGFSRRPRRLKPLLNRILIPVILSVAVLVPPFSVFAEGGQAAASPALQRREAQPAKGQPPAVTTGTSTLPTGVSGEYILGEDGQTIEIELTPKQLDGYVSVRGDRSSDKGTPLTFFFKTSSLDGVEIGFTTHRIHQTWYSFRGTIVRGADQNPSGQGYYMLDGTLTRHDVVAGQAHPRNISLPLAAQSLP